MSFDRQGERYCDECGRTIVKAHRIHKGNDYCASCYPRVFVPQPCSSCSTPVRTHRHDSEAPVCRSCERQTRRCLRCERPVPKKAARLVNERPVCGPCAPYFLEAEPCAWCGAKSTRLSRAPRIGVHEKICSACRNKLNHGSCATCRRYRPIAGLLENGMPYCSACTPGTEQRHACPSCGIALPGSGHGKCTACLNEERIARETAVQTLALEREWAKDAYRGFGRWLLEAQSSKSSLAKVFIRHFSFFARLDASTADPAVLIGNGLLEHFSVAELRRHDLPVRFLSQNAGVALEEEAKLEHIERGRIAEKLISVRREPSSAILKRYVEWLEGQQTPKRTIRLYLTAASQLCLAERLSEDRPCLEDQLQRFLRKRPGLRASLFRWISFCRLVLSWDIQMPAAPPRKQGPHRTVRELSALLAKIEDVGVERAPLGLLQRTIAKAFGFTIQHMSPSRWTLRTQDDEVHLSDVTESVRVPTAMRELVTVWMRRVSQRPESDSPTN